MTGARPEVLGEGEGFVGLIEPRRGDKITWTTPTATLEFEVLPHGDGAPSWRYSDRGRTQVRVHTKKVGEVAS